MTEFCVSKQRIVVVLKLSYCSTKRFMATAIITLGTLLSKFKNWYRLLGKRRHHYHIGQARIVLIKLRTMRNSGANYGQILGYLRKVHPSTFEELILELAERSGADITRNSRYTGDGGVDGRFYYEGTKWTVQAKRYSTAINPKHVIEFSWLIARYGGRGLFVHTGRTGNMSRSATKGNEVWFLSGSGLARSACGETSIFHEIRKMV
jgi:restriction system protein